MIEPADKPVGRIRFMDQQRVNLDGFAVEDPDLGLIALRSPHDPEPGLVISDGRVVEMDGVAEQDFDSLDAYIARHGLDLAVAAEVMALPSWPSSRSARMCREPRSSGCAQVPRRPSWPGCWPCSGPPSWGWP
jgi:propanediol dehydratase large subunit